MGHSLIVSASACVGASSAVRYPICRDTVHLVITDSGLGGLSVCAGIARGRAGSATRITYVNAWPEEGRGYNDLPTITARAAMFDRALASMAARDPDAVLIACNTLSIVYESTAFRTREPIPVSGIIDSGVELFVESLSAQPDSAVVLLGTRTTIESGVHRARLVARGVAAHRIAGVACHGLAAAIERDPGSDGTASLIESCTGEASQVAPPGTPLLAGFCCTHYTLVGDRLRDAVAQKTGRPVLALDPNARMVRDTLSEIANRREPGRVSVEVVSKVRIDQSSREAVAALIEPVSAETAAALREYIHVPNLF